MKNINDYKLTATVTVGQLQAWMKLKDENSKDKIIKLIYHRFYNRYIKNVSQKSPGFLKMAISCLIIETLESFVQGQKDTTDLSRAMFYDFFQAEKVNFPGFYQIRASFYKDIRCGILHQAETTNAWRIVLTGKLLDLDERAINAKLFLEAVIKSLDRYILALKTKPFEDPLWINAFIKLTDIINNCQAKKLARSWGSGR